MTVKKASAVFAICLLAGIAMMGAGRALGYNEDAVYYNVNGGVNAFSGEVAPFKSIDIKIVAPDIEIIPSDKYALDIRLKDDRKVFFNVSGDKLEIEQPSCKGWKCNHKGGNIKIFVPADFDCSGIKINTVSGDFKIQNISCPDTKVNSVSGSISIDNTSFGDFKIHSVSGDAVLNCGLKNQDYRKSIKTVSGKIVVDGIQTEKSYKENDTAENEIKIETVSGDIKLNFAK
jgi:hypothetical protein